MRPFAFLLILLGLGAFAFPSLSGEGEAPPEAPAYDQADLLPDAANSGAPYFAGAVMLIGGIAIIVATRARPVEVV